jgi:hypothetical protein
MKHADIKEKFLKGGKLAIDRLIERKRKDNGHVVVSEKGKVVKVTVKDLEK